jgi:hypothetical protein
VSETFEEEEEYIKIINLKQKKIDTLEKKLAEAQRKINIAHDVVERDSLGTYVRGVFLTHKEACIIVKEDYESRIKSLEEKEGK